MRIIMNQSGDGSGKQETNPTVYQPQGEQDAARRYFIEQ
jgi:hypothetical protein